MGKLNKKLLSEELSKFKLLSEYSFYTEEPDKDLDLILGSGLDEAGENAGEEDAPADDMNGDVAPPEGGEEADDPNNVFDTGNLDEPSSGDSTPPEVGEEPDMGMDPAMDPSAATPEPVEDEVDNGP